MSALLLPAYLLAIVLLALVVALEDAFFQTRGERLERLVQRRRPGARRLAQLQESHDSLAMAALMIRSTATVLFAIISFALVSMYSPWPTLDVLLGIVLTIAGVILAQAAGRVWGGHDADRLALVSAPPAAFVNAVLSIPAAALRALFRPLVRALGRIPSDSPPVERADQRATNGDSFNGADAGPMPDEEWERNVMRGLVRLESLAVREVMVPRPDVVGIEAGSSLEDAVQIVMQEGYSRLPLYRGNLDETMGIIYAKDLLASFHNKSHEATLESIVRDPFHVPETKRVGDLLREFQAKRVHIALVVDEYGSLVGLVTNEDLLEELVGDIDDEFTASEPLINRVSENEAIVDARAPLKYINEMFKVELHAEGVDTVGGLILSALGHIPHPGESVNDNGMTMTIISTTGRRVRQVRLINGEDSDINATQDEHSPTAISA